MLKFLSKRYLKRVQRFWVLREAMLEFYKLMLPQSAKTI